MTAASPVPVQIDDPVNTAILTISEDRLDGFHRDPLAEIAHRCQISVEVVTQRIRAMLEEGTIRRVRQTLLATNLAEGALVAWKMPPERLHAAFDFLFQNDPFSGHVVIRTTDTESAGSDYKLWTTLKVPQGFSLQKHAEYLREMVGAEAFWPMPAKAVFVLGVGHMRRRGIKPGSKSDEPSKVTYTKVTELSEIEWRVLMALKREFALGELGPDLWRPRAREAGVPLDEFYRVAEALNRKRVIGRFSTFLEHVKPLADGQRVAKYNALFHWAVPPERIIEAGQEIGRHLILTHCYWREAGPEFNGVNVMAVCHGGDKALVLEHKAAIDAHLESFGMPVSYTNVFWGGRSEIKPSEISPFAYLDWCEKVGLDPEAMRAQ